ncbi:hypothetical protein [Methanobrevibacter sp.]|uniref:hypothetical protein n=1 Tax=Methanobrevibacter sp. TaxID=66852 RepID=UPI0025D80B7C|nr:hypothetical protein [Methanobrevibacter sp.]MBQ2666803.1 hypothetical protein [Methanobrevibacter sp.]
MKLEFQKSVPSYTRSVDLKSNNNDLVELIKNNFKIPNNDLDNIISFIDEDEELKKIIFELPSIIRKEFPDDDMQIKFYDEFQESELILEVGIFSSFDEKSSFEKEKSLENNLYEKYDWDSVDKILILMEYENDKRRTI